MSKVRSKNVENEKLFAIWVNATNDINPCQKLEFLDSNKEIVQLDAFELFFKNPEKAKFIYASIFDDISKLLNDTDSTKFSIFSHTTNIADIRAGNTIDFIINIELKQGDDVISYNLWKLSTNEEIVEKLEKKWHSDIKIDLKTYWLEWIKNGMDDLWYVNLFNSWIWGGTHNIASSVVAFSESIKSKWFKVIAPNLEDETNKYISRTSLFLQTEDGNKYCIRTDASESQLKIVNEIIDTNKLFISDILVTDKKSLNSKSARKHSVPTIFSENVLHDVLTVVFNCEDREMWEVIDAVLCEIEINLKKNKLWYEVKTYLENYLVNLKFLKNKLYNYNRLMLLKTKWLKYKYDYIDDIKQLSLPRELLKEESKLPWLNAEIKDLSQKRLNVLKEILVSLVQVTKRTENEKHDVDVEKWLWRVVLITDWSDGSVWSLEAYNHEVFFTNSIWNIWEYEKRLFEVLNKISEWQIDINVTDTTGCWDSSTAAALMVRESNWIEIRREKYKEILKSMWVPKSSYDRAISIIEAYFLSHFQEVISGVVYHCKKSNLWDIPHSDRVTRMILWYVYKNTQEFIKNWLGKFIYSYDSSNITDGRFYNWFNVYRITEI